VLAEAYAGAAGSLYAFFISVIGPPSFTTWFSILVVMMVIIGGMGRLYGSLAGAAFVVLVSEFLGSYQEYYLSFYGILIILILIMIHKGLFEKVKKCIMRSFSVTR
jgi:branched-chain amino acid transport system permease protein